MDNQQREVTSFVLLTMELLLSLFFSTTWYQYFELVSFRVFILQAKSAPCTFYIHRAAFYIIIRQDIMNNFVFTVPAPSKKSGVDYKILVTHSFCLTSGAYIIYIVFRHSCQARDWQAMTVFGDHYCMVHISIDLMRMIWKNPSRLHPLGFLNNKYKKHKAQRKHKASVSSSFDAIFI